MSCLFQDMSNEMKQIFFDKQLRNMLKNNQSLVRKINRLHYLCNMVCSDDSRGFFLKNIVKQDKIKLSEKRPNERTKEKVISYL